MTLKDYISRYFSSRLSNNDVFAEYHRRTASKAEWKRTADIMQAKEIRDWKNAVAAATNPEDPRRNLLMHFYRSMMLDSHLMSVIDTRILKVQRSSFAIVGNDGKENEELTKLLQRPWFEELIRLVLMSRFQGTTLIEMFDLDKQTLELETVTEIPQANFIASKGIVIKEEYDTKGTSYLNEPLSDYYVQVGSSFDLGIFNQLAMPIIAKKLSVGSWMSYIDKYGVPPIFFITDRMDTARRDELFEMGQNFRQNMFVVLQGNEKIETPQISESNAHLTFESLIDNYCNKEISKRVLGGTSTTDEKSFVGSAEVQERVAIDRYEADKQLFGYMFNAKIRQRLAKISPIYKDFENHTLVWNNQESLGIKDYINAIIQLAPIFDLDIEEIGQRTGLPITGRLNLSPEIEAIVEQTMNAPEPSEVKKKDDTQALTGTTLPTAASWDKSAEELVEQIYNGNIAPEELNRNMVIRYYSGLNSATQKGWGGGYYTDELTRKFRENLLAFAGAKTFSLIKDIEALLRSNISKEEFSEEAKRLIATHNEAWQKTEEKFAGNAASSASQFRQFQADSHIFPNLRFVTMQDSHVRHSHAENEGVIKPVNQWTVVPPLDYGCRCYLEQTTDPPTGGDITTYNKTIAGNAAISGSIYSNKHPYNKRVAELPNNSMHKVWETIELTKQYMPHNATIKVGDNTVYINDFADYKDLSENIDAAKKLVNKLQQDIYIRHHTDGGKLKGSKNAEFGIGSSKTLGDLKTYSNTSSKFRNFITNAIRDCSNQKCQYSVLDISAYQKEDVKDLLISGLSGSITKNRNKNIKHVVVINKDKVGVISRTEIIDKQFNLLLKEL